MTPIVAITTPTANRGIIVPDIIEANRPKPSATPPPIFTHFHRVSLLAPANSSVVCGDEFVALAMFIAKSA